MRKPCYRVWNVSLNRMEYSDDWCNFDEFIDSYYRKSHKTKGNKIMQYVGLDDKNNKKIYEEDIIYCEDKSRHLFHVIDWKQVCFKAKVIFKNGCFTFERLEHSDEQLGLNQFSVNLFNLFGEESLSKYDIEVLGNTFENSNLLNVD